MLRIQSARLVIYIQSVRSSVLASQRNCCSLSGGIKCCHGLCPLRGCLAVSLPWLWHTRLSGLSSQADDGQLIVQAGLVQFSNGACVELPLGIPKAEAVEDCISGMVRRRCMGSLDVARPLAV